MTSVTLTYGTTPTSKTFDALDVIGFTEREEVRLYPGIQEQYASGVLANKNISIGRIITVKFGVVTEQEDREFILAFIQSPSAVMTVGALSIGVCLENPAEFSSTRFMDVSFLKEFTLRLLEKNTTVSTVETPAFVGVASPSVYRCRRHAIVKDMWNQITFTSPMPDVPEVLTFVVGSDGFTLGAAVRNVTNLGFEINPVASGSMVYYAFIPV